MSRYDRLTKQIEQMETEIEQTTRAIAETEHRVDHAEDSLEDLWNSLKTSVMNGQESSIASVEKTIQDERRKHERDKALVEALKEKLPVLEQQRESLIDERNQIIARSGEKWFPGEIATFEKQRKALLLTTRRLLAASTLLYNTGDEGRDTARAQLGEAASRLRNLKIPSIRAFDQSIYLDERKQTDLTASREERDAVIKEITG